MMRMAQRQTMRRVATTAAASRACQMFSSITPLSSPAVAAALTTTTIPTASYSSNHSSRHGLPFQTWLTAAAAAATAAIGVGGTSMLVAGVQCEEKEEDPEELGPADETEDADENGNADADADDPYDDLPDQDEPTSCTICKINRQGPCRSVWRKFEHCMKDHGGKKKEAENDSHDDSQPDKQKQQSLGEACDRYMLPWLNCVQQHRNLYTLITNNMYQHEYVDGLEESFAVSDTASSDDPKSHFLTPRHYSVQWEPYLQHILKTDTSLEDLQRDASEARATLSIRRECPTLRSKQVKAAFLDIMNSNQEPVLIESAITIPLLDPLMHNTHENDNTDMKDGTKQSKVVHLLEIAYVRDQYGNLLGFDEFSSLKKTLLNDLMENRNPGDKNAMASLTGVLPFHMIPRGTTMIQLFVVYKEKRIPTVSTEEKKTEESEQDTTIDAAETEVVAAAEIAETEMEIEGASRLYSTHQIPLAYVLKKHMANKTN